MCQNNISIKPHVYYLTLTSGGGWDGCGTTADKAAKRVGILNMKPVSII